MKVLTRSSWTRVLATVGALAVVATACGSAATPSNAVTSAASPAEAPAAASPATAPEPNAEPSAAPPTAEPDAAQQASPDESTAPAVDQEPEPVAEPTETPPEEAGRPPIQLLSADAAIANAEVNIDNLAAPGPSENVLDIEVLAVADGSVQTLRDVVVGDRPVLLWFFSPH